MMSKEQDYLMYLIPRMDRNQVKDLMSFVQKKQGKIKTVPAEHNAYKELMNVIGCTQAKEAIRSMIESFQMYKLAKDRSRKIERPRFHAVFEGNPGSNKTTCARLLAKILYEQGIVRNNSFAELSRSTFCGRYQGETAQKVRHIFESYAGGVIFIDEAYSLNDIGLDGQMTYGEEAVNELIVELEKCTDTVVIMAGYPKEMEEFLECNPGLRSRVPYTVEFKDYTVEELVQITHSIAEQKGYCVDTGADAHLRTLFAEEKKNQNFSNGRYCRNLVERAISKKCNALGIIDADGNCADCSNFRDEELFSLSEADFPGAVIRRPTHTMGFCLPSE